eukprot:6206090-Pleurochrysis_carterae.AAC.1
MRARCTTRTHVFVTAQAKLRKACTSSLDHEHYRRHQAHLTTAANPSLIEISCAILRRSSVGRSSLPDPHSTPPYRIRFGSIAIPLPFCVTGRGARVARWAEEASLHLPHALRGARATPKSA